MIHKNLIQKSIIASVLTMALVGGFALPVSALALKENANVNANAGIGGTNASTSTNANASVSTQLTKIIDRGDSAITKRIEDLNRLSARIEAIKNVSESEKANISSEIQTQINALTALKTKIDSDTDVVTALADVKTITADYRIYALIVPQGYIVASSDRIATLVTLMTALQTKLQARVTTEQTAGNNVTAMQAALTDMTAKLADATSQAQTARTTVASLVPDKANATAAASNKAALISARANLKTAMADLQAARKDIKIVLDGLKAIKKTSASTSASTSTSTSTTTTQQ